MPFIYTPTKTQTERFESFYKRLNVYVPYDVRWGGEVNGYPGLGKIRVDIPHGAAAKCSNTLGTRFIIFSTKYGHAAYYLNAGDEATVKWVVSPALKERLFHAQSSAYLGIETWVDESVTSSLKVDATFLERLDAED